jgi:5-(carboxyamino)imidazole ribonucleotide synthase
VSARIYLPGSTIGIIGGGQLGRMFALEARRLDYRTIVLDPDPTAPTAHVADEHIVAPLTDLGAADELAHRCDLVTLEWENADLRAVEALAERLPVRPGPQVLAVAQNRIKEKETARRLGLLTAPFRTVRTLQDLEDALREVGIPALLKTASGGYDGKGQRLIGKDDSPSEAFRELSAPGTELILEGWVDFRLEASTICARGITGEMASFPVVENIHRRGILDFTIAPARIDPKLRDAAAEIGRVLAEGLDVVGLLAVELFIDHDDRLLVNEIAPRPHNSGHYTWEACSVSQFEQQLRAVCGLPLARPDLLRPAAMANLLGEDIGTGRGLGSLADALRTPGVAVHLYGKAEGRFGRKMGHLTALADDADEALRRVQHARRVLIDGCGSVIHSSSPAETSG